MGIVATTVQLSRLNRARDRWRDHSLTALLVVQLLTNFGLVPAAAVGVPLPRSVALLLLLVFMSLTTIVARGRWTLAAGIGTLLLNAAVATLQHIDDNLTTEIAFDLSALTTFAVLTTVVAIAVFRPGRMTGHRLTGAVVLYLDVGLLFAFVHRIVADLLPGAYSNIPSPHDEAAFRAALDYFSFSTLTSIGYGDIVPLHPVARSLATMEAAVGQLLPTVLIGRVVTLAMRQSELTDRD